MAMRREHQTIVTREPVIAAHAETAASEHESVAVHEDGWSLARGYMGVFNALVGFVLLVVEIALGFRLAFALAGANAANGFVDFIYDVSRPLVSPFEGIVNEQVSGSSVFEPETVIAMAVYAVVAIIIVAFVNILTSAPAPVRTEAVTRDRHTHVDGEI